MHILATISFIIRSGSGIGACCFVFLKFSIGLCIGNFWGTSVVVFPEDSPAQEKTPVKKRGSAQSFRKLEVEWSRPRSTAWNIRLTSGDWLQLRENTSLSGTLKYFSLCWTLREQSSITIKKHSSAGNMKELERLDPKYLSEINWTKSGERNIHLTSPERRCD